MTAPDRYDRRDPCPDCGEPACVCGDDWPDDDPLSDWQHPAWLERERRLWSGVDPADYGLRAVRDLRVEGDLL